MKGSVFFPRSTIVCFSSMVWVSGLIITKWAQPALLFPYSFPRPPFLFYTRSFTLPVSASSQLFLFLAENQSDGGRERALPQPSLHSWTHCSSRPWWRFHFYLYLIGYTPPQPIHIINLPAGSTWVGLCCPISYWTQTFSRLHPTRERQFNSRPVPLIPSQVRAASSD